MSQNSRCKFSFSQESHRAAVDAGGAGAAIDDAEVSLLVTVVGAGVVDLGLGEILKILKKMKICTWNSGSHSFGSKI